MLALYLETYLENLTWHQSLEHSIIEKDTLSYPTQTEGRLAMLQFSTTHLFGTLEAGRPA